MATSSAATAIDRERHANAFLTHGHFSHISQWYPCVKHMTADTAFVELSAEQLRALVKLTGSTRQLCKQQFDGPDENSHEVPTSQNIDEVAWALQMPAHQSALQSLETLLDTTLRTLPGERPLGAFVRLDTRSPKDGVFYLPIVKNLLQRSVLARSFPSPHSAECESYDEACFHQAIIQAQRVHTGKEIIQLLCRSQRVEADLVLGQLANMSPGKVCQPTDAGNQIVIRRWDPRIHPLCEVRAFVYNGRCTALTQYYKTAIVPALLSQQKRVRELVLDAVARVHPCIEHLLPDSTSSTATFYTLDFALIGETGPDSLAEFSSALLIEVNPPPPVAGTILFDWELPADRALLQGARGFLSSHNDSFRLVQRAVPWRDVPLHPPLKRYIDTLRQRKASRMNQEHFVIVVVLIFVLLIVNWTGYMQ